ncbi:MAG: helix-turn-helix domain-containing protein [Chitinophagaceae bacterium]
MNALERNERFTLAAAFVNQTGKNVFLTGKAGTGKTTFLKYIRDNCYKNMVVLAPTGVAAINAGGVTIHSFFQLPFGLYSPNTTSGWGSQDDGSVYNKNRLLSKIRFNKSKLDLIRELDLIVVDEVSMVRADLLDAMDDVLRSVRRSPDLPFGGVQMLFIGDLFQLPPVVTNAEADALGALYASPFFFSSRVLQQSKPIFVELDKIYRQNDGHFIQLLNSIRNNTCQTEEISLLNTYLHPEFEPSEEEEYITLSSHNYIADRINQNALDNLPGKLYRFEASVTDDFPEKSYPAQKVLELKQDAQIMFIKNDKGENRRYYNGKIGRVASIDSRNIQIRFKDEKELLDLPLEKWSNIRYDYDSASDKVNEEELGTFEQYPIRLAWAITIHKSQGLTFDKAIIDAGQAFAAGQVYVALSRLTSLEGLVLRSRITASSINTDRAIVAYVQDQQALSGDVETLLAEAQKSYMGEWTMRIFDWTKLREKLRDFLVELDNKAIGDKGRFVEVFQKIVAAVDAQYEVAIKFARFLQINLPQGALDQYAQLYARTQSAGKWFTSELDKNVMQPFKELQELARIRKRTSKLQKELALLHVLFEQKKKQIQQAVLLVKGLSEQQPVKTILDTVNAIATPTPTPYIAKKVKEDTRAISLEMFRDGMSIEDIAKERGFVPSTIETHLMQFLPTGEIDISAFADEDACKRIGSYLQHHPESVPSSEVRAAFNDAFSYTQIRAVRIWHQIQKTK